MPRPTPLDQGDGTMVQTFADERVAPSIRFFGELTKRNENFEPSRLFMRKWNKYWVILEEHFLRFYKNISSNQTPHLHGKTELVGCIDVADCKIDRVVHGYGPKPFLFRVTAAKGTRFLFEAITETEFRGWTSEIAIASQLGATVDDADEDELQRQELQELEQEYGFEFAEEELTEDEKGNHLVGSVTGTMKSFIKRNRAGTLFRKLSQTEAEMKVVRVKRKNLISSKGQEPEIVEIYKYDAINADTLVRGPEATLSKAHIWERVLTMADIIPVIESSALHFSPHSGYLVIRGGRFGKAGVRLWCEIQSFAKREMTIHKEDNLQEKVGKMDLSNLTCIEELSDSPLTCFEIVVSGERYILGADDERQAIAWFDVFALVQKHLLGGDKGASQPVPPEKKGWLMRSIIPDDTGTVIWKSRWCELYESHMEVFENTNKLRLLEKIILNERTKVNLGGPHSVPVVSGDQTASKQFTVVTDEKEASFMATSKEERDQWLVTLRANILMKVGQKHPAGYIPEFSGYLKKCDLTATTKKKTRYFKQKGHYVTYSLNEMGEKPLGSFTLKGATVTASKATDIEVYSGTRCFLLTADSEIERNEWLQSLNEGTRVPASYKVPGDDKLHSEEEIVIAIVTKKPSDIRDEGKPVIKSKLILKQIGGNRVWKMRFLVLKGSTLFYYKSRQGKKPTGILVLTRSSVVFPSDEAKAGSFVVVSEKRRLVFATSNTEDRDEWISLIDNAIKSSTYVANHEQFGDTTEGDNEPETPVAASSQEEEEKIPDVPGASKYGWLEKQDRRKKEWQRRWFVQKGPVLTYYADDKETKPLGRIILTMDDGIISPKTMKNDTTAPLPFIIQTSEGRKLSLMAPNHAELTDWISHLKKGLAQSANFVKPGSMREFSDTEEGELVDTSQVPPNAALKGWLFHQSGKTWRKRYFVLQCGVISYFRSPSMSKFSGQMVLRQGDQIALVVDDREHQYSFFVDAKYPPRRLKMAAESKEDMERWTRTILASIPKVTNLQEGDYEEHSEPEVLAKASEENPSATTLITPAGPYRGWLLKYSESDRAWRKRYFAHQGHFFTYFKSDKGERPKGRFCLCDEDVVNGSLMMKSQEKVMRITIGTRTITLAASSKLEYEEWVRRFAWAVNQPKAAGEEEEVFSEDEAKGRAGPSDQEKARLEKKEGTKGKEKEPERKGATKGKDKGKEKETPKETEVQAEKEKPKGESLPPPKPQRK